MQIDIQFEKAAELIWDLNNHLSDDKKSEFHNRLLEITSVLTHPHPKESVNSDIKVTVI